MTEESGITRYLQPDFEYHTVHGMLAQDAHKISELCCENDRLRRKAKAHKKSITQMQKRLHTLKLENERLRTNLKTRTTTGNRS